MTALPEAFAGMTLNERLFAAGLADAFDAASKTGDSQRINEVLSRVQLWQDENGMNWSK